MGLGWRGRKHGMELEEDVGMGWSWGWRGCGHGMELGLEGLWAWGRASCFQQGSDGPIMPTAALLLTHPVPRRTLALLMVQCRALFSWS